MKPEFKDIHHEFILLRHDNEFKSDVYCEQGAEKAAAEFSVDASEDKKEASPTKKISTQIIPQATSTKSATFTAHFGNYQHYYGYRCCSADLLDCRLQLMKAEWFEEKDVLDVGCNAGKVTVDIARRFHPSKVVGVDIDRRLIHAAKQSLTKVKHSRGVKRKADDADNRVKKLQGGVEADMSLNHQKPEFSTRKIFFVQANYVPDDEACLATVMSEYDVIIAFSVTKWMHLNYGDDGLKRVFHKMHKQLRGGGLLLLEAQDWSSYRKRKKMKQTNFCCNDLLFRPEHFTDFLLTEVGFVSHCFLGTPLHPSKGGDM